MTGSDGFPDDLTTPEAAQMVAQHEMVKCIKDDISRGLYSRRHLRQKYGKYFDEQEMDVLVDGLITMIAHEDTIDIRMEIMGYLLSSTEFQATLYGMMKMEEAAGRTRNVVEIVKLLSSLKNDRLEFIREIGIPIAMYQEGKQVARPEKVDLSAMLEAGQKVLSDARRNDAQEFAGKRSNGSEGDASGDLGGEQVSVHPAGDVPALPTP